MNEYIIYNNASSSVHPLLLTHIKIHQYICLELFLLVNGAWSEHISLYIQKKKNVFTGENNIMDRGLIFYLGATVSKLKTS